MAKKEPVKAGKNRDKNGRFIKGVSGNPNGRPKGPIHIKELEEAILRAEKAKDKGFLDRVIERAYVNDAVLLAVLKKFIPDKQHMEVEGSLNQPVDLSALSTKELKKLAYEIERSNQGAKKGNSKAGKN